MDAVEQRRSALKAEVIALIDSLELHKFSSLDDVAQTICERNGFLPFIWHIDDIRQAWADMHHGKPEDCPLDDLQCLDILRKIKRVLYATVRITWDVIEYHLQEAGHCP